MGKIHRRLVVLDRHPVDGEHIIEEHDVPDGQDGWSAAREHLAAWMEDGDLIRRRGDCFYIVANDGTDEEIDVFAEVHGS